MVIQSQAGEHQMHAGCTAIVALKCATTLYVANAGDSRGVLCRAGVPLLAQQKNMYRLDCLFGPVGLQPRPT